MKRRQNPDNPELTDAFFAAARPLSELGDGAVVAAMRRHRGAQRKPTKKAVSIRLSPEVLEQYRSTGRGWQSRIDEDLLALVTKRSKAVAAKSRMARRPQARVRKHK